MHKIWGADQYGAAEPDVVPQTSSLEAIKF